MRPGLRLGAGAGAAAAALALALLAAPSVPAPRGAPGPVQGPEAPVPPEAAGVELLSLRVTARGRLLDLRYRVRVPERAAGVLGGEAYLLTPEGRVLGVPVTAKAGALRVRPRRLEAGRIYYALFANEGARIQPGTAVTVVLGGLQAPGVRVE